MQTMLQDLRYALRQIGKSPGFTLTAVISLALGIGATTAVFSVIYAALMNPYPYPAADRIVRLMMQTKAGPSSIFLNGPQIQQLRPLPIVESVLAADGYAMSLTGHDLPEDVDVVRLGSTDFDALGVPPVLGRGLLPSDAPDGQEPKAVTVLSYKFWQKHFFSNPDVVGKTLQLNRKSYLIVGVAAPRFTWYMGDVFLPLTLTPDPGLIDHVDILLRPDVTHEAADAALEPLLRAFARDTPKQFPEHFRVKVEGLNEWVVRGIGGTLYLLFGAVALLLAIGCANVSILLLARGTARQQELSVRAAVGASRSRLVGQLLTESLMLAAIGAALGVLTAYGMLSAIKGLLPRYAFAPEVVIHINLPVLFFSVGVALATGILFGLWPALELSRTQPSQAMQVNVHRVAGSVRGRRAHNALIAGQIALTLLLLAAAGSAMEGFVSLMHQPLGYDPHHVMAVGIPLAENSHNTWGARGAYFEQLRAKVAEVPGVTMAAISSNEPPPRSGGRQRFEILGKPAGEEQMASVNCVSPGYFRILYIPLLEGRVWTETENHDGAHLAVINRTLARRYFPNGDAIGHSLKLPRVENRPPEILSPANIADSWLQIVGIVGDARNDGLRNPIKPAVYVPYTLSMWEWTWMLVRSEVPPLTLPHAVGAQVAAVNPEQQIYSYVEDLDTWISIEPEWQQEHLAAWLFSVLAWLALALAAVGLYSVVSYTVAQRTNEFGIRMALGAERGDVMRVVFASTLGIVGIGILAGLVLTLSMNTILAKWAQGNSHDPMLLLAGTLLLSIVSGVACAIPAWRAAKVDPMTALRCE
jgi:predicted permease